MAAPTTTYRMWKRPGGTRLFSAAAMVRVPYFASVVPHVVRMEPGFAEDTAPKWFFLYNHLHTVHAIASDVRTARRQPSLAGRPRTGTGAFFRSW
jgi:Domain of unknown function (DUF4442)